MAIGDQSFQSTIGAAKPVIVGVAVTPIDGAKPSNVVLFGDATHVLGPFGTYAQQVLHIRSYSNVVWSDVVWSDVTWSDVTWSDVVWSDVATAVTTAATWSDATAETIGPRTPAVSQVGCAPAGGSG